MEQCKKSVLALHPDDPAQWQDGLVVKQSLPWPYDPGVGYPCGGPAAPKLSKGPKECLYIGILSGDDFVLVLLKVYLTLQEHFQGLYT